MAHLVSGIAESPGPVFLVYRIGELLAEHVEAAELVRHGEGLALPSQFEHVRQCLVDELQEVGRFRRGRALNRWIFAQFDLKGRLDWFEKGGFQALFMG